MRQNNPSAAASTRTAAIPIPTGFETDVDLRDLPVFEGAVEAFASASAAAREAASFFSCGFADAASGLVSFAVGSRLALEPADMEASAASISASFSGFQSS